MRCNDNGAISPQVAKPPKQLRLAVWVEVRRGFVQEPEWRVAEDGARERQALTLST
jgi:hypothetical protein